MDAVPLPEPDQEVDEKTRLRRQEELLLPSQPPQEGESSSTATDLSPSAPVIPETHDPDNEALHGGITTPSTPGPPASVYSARSADTVRPYSTSPPPPPLTVVSDVQPTDDKQELERRRLMTQTSAPPSEDAEAGSSRATAPPPFTASAPVLTDEDLEHGPSHEVGAEESQLPQYQR